VYLSKNTSHFSISNPTVLRSLKTSIRHKKSIRVRSLPKIRTIHSVSFNAGKRKNKQNLFEMPGSERKIILNATFREPINFRSHANEVASEIIELTSKIDNKLLQTPAYNLEYDAFQEEDTFYLPSYDILEMCFEILKKASLYFF